MADLAKRWQADTLDLKPDMVGILVGVNDNRANPSMDEYEQGYDRLLSEARAALPDPIRVVRAVHVAGQHQGGVRNLVEGATRSGRRSWPGWQKDGAALVRFQAVFEAACLRAPADYWIWDGVRPTYSGHQLMADAWMQAVREFWPAPPN